MLASNYSLILVHNEREIMVAINHNRTTQMFESHLKAAMHRGKSKNIDYFISKNNRFMG